MMGSKKTMSDWSADLMRFQKRLKSAGLVSSYKRMALNAFVAWVHLIFSAKEIFNLDANSSNRDHFSSYAIPVRDRTERK